MASARIAWVLQEPDCTGFCEAACELLEGLYSDLSDDRSGFFRGMGLAPCLHDRTEDASLFMVPVFLARIEELCHKMPGSAAVRRVRQLLKCLRPRSVITWKRLEQALLVQTGPEPNGIARYTGDCIAGLKEPSIFGESVVCDYGMVSELRVPAEATGKARHPGVVGLVPRQRFRLGRTG